MLIIISPAKTQDFETPSQTRHQTQCRFKDESIELLNELKNYSIKDLQKLMGVSENIAELNYKRFQKFDQKFSDAKSKQALATFKGDVYRPFELDEYSDDDFQFAQKHLRMLSGFYGILRPFDMMQPYRLEMKTKLKTNHGKNLYDFWGDKLTKSLEKDIIVQGDDILINLASNEYSKAANLKSLKARIITPVFLERREEGEPKVIAIFSKKARGVMSNWIIRNRIEKPEQLKEFNIDQYKYSEKLSNGDELVFIR